MVAKDNYIIICDESSKKGEKYSYFYGGAILRESKYEKISTILENYKNSLGLNELKRTKITNKNYKSYIEVIDLFFTFVKSGEINIRLMYSPNGELKKDIPHSLNETYTKFYFAFIKNAFNIFYAKENINLRILFDDLPETKEQCLKFKKLLIRSIISNKKPNTNKVFIKKQDIVEVDSKKHIILQCMDVIVGLLDFYLNTSSEKIEESIRAKAKQNVWDFVYRKILEINPSISFDKTTTPIYSHKGWRMPYQHFVYHQKKN